MYAELVINIEAPLAQTFHYHVPFDLREQVAVGQLVEVEFGKRLAQAVIVRFDSAAPVEDTKPIISIIDSAPVLRPWQLALAHWLSEAYLAPLNACVRLMLPPGLTRWSDVTLDVNPQWDGSGRLTEAQAELISLLRAKGDLRGRQLKRLLPKASRGRWQTVARQLVGRGILRQGTVLDPPRIRPKTVHHAELITDPEKIRAEVVQLGRANKAADVLNWLATAADPLPSEADVLAATGAGTDHLDKLVAAGLITRLPAQRIDVGSPGAPEWVEQPATVGLRIRPKDTLSHILTLRGAEKYYRVLHALAAAAQPVAVADLYAATDASLTHLRKLAELDLIRLSAAEVWRDPLADRDFVPAERPMLTLDQARVWGRIRVQMEGEMELEGELELELEGELEGEAGDGPDDSSSLLPPLALLLHGVTGSGKTEIYMRAIDLALQHGRQAIVLVPEIALTPQTVRRFAARFPGRVAVLHSGLSDGERYDTWRRARQGLFDIVIGPRSALFTPLAKLGVIVMDEEHDDSYKQTPPVPPPYYHARDAAVALGRLTGALVILGSATPDLVTYHRAQSGEYQLLELPKRVMGHRQRITGQMARLGRETAFGSAESDPDDALTIPLPPIQVVDLRQELRAGNRTIFSRALQTELDATLARGEQAILFLNRRGTSTFIICRDCGHTLKCPRCDTPLTYHRSRFELVCHYCGHSEPQHTFCPNCRSRRIKYFGLGTEELEELVGQRWPTARTVRWDRDTTAGRDTHDQLLASFVNHEADVLVGTQMIAKGLDLPLVTLVGVISADVSLGLPDFRTGERAFQVLTQVAGRAGRGLLGGRVIIQTYQPEHYAIQAAAEHDFAAFYVEEIRFRTRHMLPPFRRMARLEFSDPVPGVAEREARTIADRLRRHAREKLLTATEILGPVPPFFSRIDRRFRWQIVIRSADPTQLLRDFPLPPRWVVDIDPVSTL